MFGDEFNSGSPYTAFGWDGINKFENEPPSNRPFPPIQGWSGKRGAAYTNGAAVGTQQWYNSMVHAGVYEAHHALPSPFFIEGQGRDINPYDRRRFTPQVENKKPRYRYEDTLPTAQEKLESAEKVFSEMLQEEGNATARYQYAFAVLHCLHDADAETVRVYTDNVMKAEAIMVEATATVYIGRQHVNRCRAAL